MPSMLSMLTSLSRHPVVNRRGARWVVGFARRFFRLLRCVGGASQLLRQIWKHRQHMARGVYRIQYANQGVCVLRRVDSPDVLTLSTTIQGLWGPMSRIARIGAKIFLWVQIHSTDDGFTTLLVRTTGKALLFDVERKCVLRIEQGITDEAFLQFRASISTIYQVPEVMQVTECGLLEQYVVGKMFSELSTSAQLMVLSTLISSARKSSRRCQSLANIDDAAGTDTLKRSFKELRPHLADCDAGRYVHESGSKYRLCLREAPLFSALGDLTRHNCVVLGRTLIPVDISPRKVGWAPVFFDACTLAHSELVEYGSAALAICILEGGLDDSLRHSPELEQLCRLDLFVLTSMFLSALAVKIEPRTFIQWLSPVFVLAEAHPKARQRLHT